jgi:hypothetical protein
MRQKPFWWEWVGLVLVLASTFSFFYSFAYAIDVVPRSQISFVWRMLPSIVAVLCSFGLLIEGGKRRSDIRRQDLIRRSEDGQEFLNLMRTAYPPNNEVLSHLQSLGYGGVVTYIRLLEAKAGVKRE